jgi:hypothetical protein
VFGNGFDGGAPRRDLLLRAAAAWTQPTVLYARHDQGQVPSASSRDWRAFEHFFVLRP